MNNTFEQYRKKQAYFAYQWDGDFDNLINECKECEYEYVIRHQVSCLTVPSSEICFAGDDGNDIYVHIKDYIVISDRVDRYNIEVYTEDDFEKYFVKVEGKNEC